MKVNLDINDVAVKQLESAIWMYAYDYDEVAVHTIAAAAFELFNERLGLINFRKMLEVSIKPEKVSEVLSLWNMPYNFFKHGQHRRRSIESITYETETVELILYLASSANLIGPEKYRLNCSLVYKTFFIVNHRELIDEMTYKSAFDEALNKLNLSDDRLRSLETLRMMLDLKKHTFVNGTDSPYKKMPGEL